MAFREVLQSARESPNTGRLKWNLNDKELFALAAAITGAPTKDSVRAATTAALPAHTRSGNVLTASANGALPAQDGVTLSLNQRLLVKNEGGGTHLENGLYYVSAVGSASALWTLTRATDADASAEVASGMLVYVEEGTANGGKVFELTTAGSITLNTTALTFAEYTGPGGGGAADLQAHLDDTTDAHDASAISYGGSANLAATNVEAALDELDSEKASAASLTDHLNDTSDAHDASAISFSPTGTVAATDVQAAIAEVASEAASGGSLPTMSQLQAFAAYSSNVTTVSGGSNNDMIFGTEEFDPANRYSTGNGRYTPLTAGYYRISARVASRAMRADTETNSMFAG